VSVEEVNIFPSVTQGTNKVSRKELEKKQHEDNVGDLSESSSPAERRLGLWQR